MIKSSINYAFVTMVAVGMVASPVQGADKPAPRDAKEGEPMKEAPVTADLHKADESKKAIPFHGSLTAKSDSSITVGKRVFHVNSGTKIVKDGKPATLADGEIGNEVAGQYRELEGKLIAKSIRFGPKPEKLEREKHENKHLGDGKAPGEAKAE